MLSRFGCRWSCEIQYVENLEDAESIPVKFTWHILTKPEDTVIIKDEFGPIISPILMETVEKKYNSIITIKDSEIKRLSDLAMKDKTDYSALWFTGGALAGIALKLLILPASASWM